MKYKIEVLSDLPVLITSFEEDFGSTEDIESYIAELVATYDSLDHKVYAITDTTNLKLTFDKVMEFLRVALRTDENLNRHPNKIGNIVITTSNFYQAVIKGLRTASFGNMQLEVFDSRESALSWVRDQAA